MQKNKETEEIIPLLTDFPERFIDFLKIARFSDKILYKEIVSKLDSYKIDTNIMQMLIRLQIEREKKISSEFYVLTRTMFDFLTFKYFRRREGLFKEENISIHQMLGGLSYLKSYIKYISKDYWDKHFNDDEIFKPSNVDLKFVLVNIENAYTSINEHAGLGHEDKEKLLEYLETIKKEIARETPSWKKIIGALLILSTLLSGMANAPKWTTPSHSATIN